MAPWLFGLRRRAVGLGLRESTSGDLKFFLGRSRGGSLSSRPREDKSVGRRGSCSQIEWQDARDEQEVRRHSGRSGDWLKHLKLKVVASRRDTYISMTSMAG